MQLRVSIPHMVDMKLYLVQYMDILQPLQKVYEDLRCVCAPAG